jgi:hypothetical protein
VRSGIYSQRPISFPSEASISSFAISYSRACWMYSQEGWSPSQADWTRMDSHKRSEIHSRLRCKRLERSSEPSLEDAVNHLVTNITLFLFTGRLDASTGRLHSFTMGAGLSEMV